MAETNKRQERQRYITKNGKEMATVYYNTYYKRLIKLLKDFYKWLEAGGF